jgi:DNA-binding CsgD family transcriptional regulator
VIYHCEKVQKIGTVSAMEFSKKARFNQLQNQRLGPQCRQFLGVLRVRVQSLYKHMLRGSGMSEKPVRLGQREQQIVELLLQGCDNDEIARQLNMARRTVKAHFNRLFLRFGITSGIKRVKLATLLYRRQLCLETNVTESAYPANERAELSNLLPRDLRTKKLPTKLELPNTSSRITSESSTTSSDSGIESNSPSGTRHADSSKSRELDPLEAWEHSILGLGETSSSGTHR